MNWRSTVLLIIGSVAVLAALALTPWGVRQWSGETLSSGRGAFGDQFGATSALFSGLAFIAAILALWLQSVQLREQQEEIVDQQKQIHQQTEAIRRQAFEGTFFRLAEMHLKIVDQIGWIRPNGNSDRLALADYANKLVKRLRELRSDDREAGVATIYDQFYREYASQLGHYFRHIYNTIRFANDSDLPDGDKYRYVRHYRALLSDSELILLFYNCIGRYGRDRMRPLADKYDLFDNLRISELAELTDRSLTKSSMTE